MSKYEKRQLMQTKTAEAKLDLIEKEVAERLAQLKDISNAELTDGTAQQYAEAYEREKGCEESLSIIRAVRKGGKG